MTQYSGKNAVNFLNEQFWHDSILYEIRIIRTNSLDQVAISINLLMEEDEWASKKHIFLFNNCYHIETKMHGGVSCMSDGEMISYATAKLNCQLIEKVSNTWEKTKNELPELFNFSMLLASTGSKINIVCQSVNVSQERGIKKHNAPQPIAPTR
jgi:hypothetical protein